MEESEMSYEVEHEVSPLEVVEETVEYQEFFNEINKILKENARSFNNPTYDTVEVLSLYWEKSDKERGLGIKQDLAEWERLCKLKGWNNTLFEIPSSRSWTAVGAEMGTWEKRLYDASKAGKRPLAILYYNGHSMRRRGMNTVWVGEEHKRPFIDPTTVFKRLEDYEHDILSILDTCYAADVTKSSGTKVYTKELLTATNVEIAKAGPLSFTKTLVSILEKSDKADVLQIFDKLVLREGGHHCHHVFYPVTGSHTPILLHSIVPGEQVVEEVATPKVEHEYTALIAVKMSGGHGEVTEWIDYITKDVPKPVIGVKIEKVWGSTSILLLIRLPIRVYCMLPVKFAYTFIAYVSEEIHHEESPPEKTLELSENQLASRD